MNRARVRTETPLEARYVTLSYIIVEESFINSLDSFKNPKFIFFLVQLRFHYEFTNSHERKHEEAHKTIDNRPIQRDILGLLEWLHNCKQKDCGSTICFCFIHNSFYI